MKKILCSLFLSAGLLPAAQAAVIEFETGTGVLRLHPEGWQDADGFNVFRAAGNGVPTSPDVSSGNFFVGSNDAGLLLSHVQGSAFNITSFSIGEFTAPLTVVYGFLGSTVATYTLLPPPTLGEFYTFSVAGNGLTGVAISSQVTPTSFRIDDIVVSAVPEVETFALMLAGLGVLALRGRRPG